MNRSEYFSSDYTKLGFNRSILNLPFQHQTAFNTGDIVPLMAVPVLPGDTWKTKVAYLLRMFTPMKQIFNNMYIDFYAHFVPYRLVWNHWVNFLGQNDSTAWTETNTYTIPQNTIVSAQFSSYFESGTLGDYLGINFTSSTTDGQANQVTVSDLFRRSYLCIYNEWYRDENLIAPILYSKGDNKEVSPAFDYDDKLLKAAKFHDYFTVLLPEPMKGTPPTIGDALPVVSGSEHVKAGDTLPATRFKGVSFGTVANVSASDVYVGVHTDSSNVSTGQLVTTSTDFSNTPNLVPSNLWASVTITIEDIRKAAVATHVMEKLATSGSRYPEFLLGMWSVTSPNAELQIPELLGSQRFPIRIAEVVSNSDTATASGGQYLGATGALVKSGDTGALFNKAFTEYGQLWITGVVRIEQNYFQGLDRKFFDKSFFDFYLPALANIGAQPVFKKQLVARNRSGGVYNGDDVFGYSEPWAHLRHIPYQVSSVMRPDVPNGLSSWTASDIYDTSSGLTLNQAFIEQSAAGLDRCIAIPSTTRGAFQWFGEFKFDNEVTRIIEPHGMPGVGRI